MRHVETVRRFCEQHPAFSESSVRWLIFNAEKNGLAASGAILRNGRRIILDVDRFFEWLDSRQWYQAGGGCDSTAPASIAAKSSD